MPNDTNDFSTIRADVSPIQPIASGSLSPFAFFSSSNWVWHIPFTNLANENINSYGIFIPHQGMPGEIFLSWPSAQKISNIQLFCHGWWPEWNIKTFFKASSTDPDWQPINSSWDVTFPNPSDQWTFSLSASFSTILAESIRVSCLYEGSYYPYFYFGELAIYGEPSIKISSPINGEQFFSGLPIPFISRSTANLVSYSWTCDNAPLGLTPNSANTSAADLSPGTHTIRLTAVNPANSSVLDDSITICVYDIAEIKIKNLNTQDFLSYTETSYRAAKTQFQAIGYREDGSEIGPVSVRWDLEGGEVDAQDQLKMGILSQLGQLNTKIGNLDNSLALVASSSTVTFNSFLPGNITIKASKGNLTDSVNVRIKQPHFKVNVYPVGDVDTSIFDIWKDTALQIWEKENIIKVDSIDLMPPIANVSYPNAPFGQPMRGAESFLSSELYVELDLAHPLVYDCLLGDTSGFFNVPRQTGLLMENGEASPVNVFMVKDSFSYYVSDPFTNPPEKQWREPYIYSISSLDHFVTLENSCATIKTPTTPYFDRHKRYLAAGIGRNFGLPQYANWLNNFMDFSDNGALDVTPLQYIAALNYNNDNPQNSVKFREE